MNAFTMLAIVPALVLAAPVVAQEDPADGSVVILFGAEGLPDPEPLVESGPAADGVVDFDDAEPLDLPEIAAPAVPAMATPDPAAIAQTVRVPEDWIEHEEYGLRFALPPGFAEIDRDENNAEMMLMLGTLDMRARAGVAYTIAFIPPQDAAEMREEVGAQFGIGTLQAESDPVDMVGFTWTEYQAATDAADLGGVTASVALRMLMGDTPNGYGMIPMIMMAYFSEDRAAHLETERAFLGSLRVTGPLGAPEPEVLRDGAVSYRVPAGGRVAGGISPTETWVVFGEGRADYARVVVGELGMRDGAARSFLRSGFAGTVSIVDGVFDGVPVWIVTGRPAYDLLANPTVEGDQWRAMSVVTQVCPGQQGPLVLTAVTTAERIGSGLSLEGLLAGAQLHLEGAARCPDAVFAAFAEPMARAESPGAEALVSPNGEAQAPATPETSPLDPPVAVAEPGLDDSERIPDVVAPMLKPAVPVPAEPPVSGLSSSPATVPDDAAWARADAAQTPAAMLDYLSEWPQGAYAERARDWLARRAIAVPQDRPRDPDAQAWAMADAAQSADAMLRYLRDWPRGVHADDARAWLSARAIVPPAEPSPRQPGAAPGK